MASAQKVVLTIAGSDSGAGAGIQADLKTFAALGVYGTCAVTAVTAQSPRGVAAVQAVEPALVAAQIRAVRGYYPVLAAKTGMLLSAGIVNAVADALGEFSPAPQLETNARLPLVVDPVMVSTSGTRLLQEDAFEALTRRIFPLAALITPNADEAAALGVDRLEGPQHLERAARGLHARFLVPVLLKGGHLPAHGTVTDCLFDGREATRFTRDWAQGVDTHGTGCTLSAAIAAYLALGRPLVQAVELATRYVQRTLEQALAAGPSAQLNHGARPE